MHKSQRCRNRNKTSEKSQQIFSKKLPDSPEVARINSIRQQLKKSIEDPIQNIQQLQSNKTPQRCLFHNNILSLYCQIDRKPLCANCMYQQQTHRKHRVVPISKVIHCVKQDITSFITKIQSNISQCQSFSRRLQQTIGKNETYYPSLRQKLKKHYKTLIMILKQKQMEQITFINQLKDKMKNQILYLDNQVKKIINLLSNKLNTHKKQENQESILFKRNVLQILTKTTKIINNDLSDVFPQQQNTKNIINFNLFTDIGQQIKSKLIIYVPSITNKPKYKIRSQGSIKNYSPDIKINSQNKIMKKTFVTPYNHQLFNKNNSFNCG